MNAFGTSLRKSKLARYLFLSLTQPAHVTGTMTTTIFPRPDGPLTLPGLELEETPDRVSPQAAQQTQSTTNGTLGKAIQPSYQKPGAQHRVLSSDEWIQFCRGVGVMGDDESTKIIRPTCW